MNRQLLPRQRAQAPRRAPARPASPAPAAPPAPPAGRPAPGRTASPGAGPRRTLRRPAVLALVALACVALIALGWTLLSSSSGTAADGAPPVLLPPGPTAAATSVSASPSSTDGDVPGTARDPFAEADAAPGAPTSPAHVPVPLPPASASTAGPTPVPAPSSELVATPASDATATVTVSATYIGLYAWNGDRASFRVNTRTWSVPAGTTFGPGLRFTAVVPGTPRCARVQHDAGTFTLCPGQVTALP